MGKQINFYLTKNDVKDLLLFLKSTESFNVLEEYSESVNPVIVKDSNNFFENIKTIKYFLIRENDLTDVVMKNIPAQKKWEIDYLRSPVIELIVFNMDGNRLNGGRFFYIEKYFGDDDKTIIKKSDFINWAKIIFLKTRKHLVKHDRGYIGKEALALLQDSKITLGN